MELKRYKDYIFIDTCYILALANMDDENHQIAKEIAGKINGSFITTEQVLIEVGNALAKTKWRQLAISTINDLINDTNIEIIPNNSETFHLAFKLYSSRKDKEWGLTDCISIVIMNERGIREVLSCDEHFTQAGFHILLK